jgi:hypothetical protein
VRTISAADDALFTATGGRCDFLRVDVKDSGGTFRDLTTYPGENMVISASWGEAVDQPSLNGTVVLKREVELLSLSPLMDTSALNLAFNPSGTPAPLLFPKREIKIYTASLPDGVQPTAGDWKLAMHGQIDELDFGKPETVELKISDFNQAQLRDLLIERERVYAHADPADVDSTKGLLIFELNRAYVLNQLVMPSEAKRNGFFYKATIAGTSSATVEPVWPTVIGGTVTSGGVQFTNMGFTTTTTGTAVETVLGQLSADNGSSVAVTTPVSPGWLIKWYLQQRGGMAWDAMRALVDQIGWDLRSVYDSGTTSFKLKFFSIDRAKVAIDRTFSKSEVLKINKLAINLADIRNVVRIVFSNSAVLDSDLHPVRDWVEVSDAGSIALFGRRYMEIQEAGSSNIDTSTEASTMATAALKDLATPNAEQEAELEFFPFVELGDLYRFSPDALHHSADLDLAVVGYQHSFDKDGRASTTLTLRGKPSGGCERWLARATEINTQDTHSTTSANSAGGMVVNATGKIVGGAHLKVNPADVYAKHALPQGFDLHLSTSPGFTPGSATFQGTMQGNRFTAGDQYPGGTVYGQTIPWSWNSQRKVNGLPSAEFSFTPGFVEPAHLNPEAFRGELPPNGSFEGLFRGTGFPPDRWEMGAAGVWNTDVQIGPIKAGPAAKDGARYLRMMTTSVATAVRSEWFPVNGGNVYQLRSWIYRNGGANSVNLSLEWVDGTKGAISTSTLTTALSSLTDSAWNQVQTVFTAPAGAAFARFIVAKNVASTDQWNCDGCRVEDLGPPFVDVATFSGTWVNFGGSDANAGYRLWNGFAELRGKIKSGTVNTAAFTLPAALFPQHPKNFPVVSNGAFGHVVISTAGVVTPAVGNNTYFDLSPCRWPIF